MSSDSLFIPKGLDRTSPHRPALCWSSQMFFSPKHPHKHAKNDAQRVSGYPKAQSRGHTEQSDTCWHLHRKHFFISSQHCVIRPHFHLKVSCLLTHLSNPIFSGMLSEQEFFNSSIPAELVNWLSLISQQDTEKTFSQ